MPEVWKTIPGFEKYEVSNRGRVRSFWNKDGKRARPYMMTLSNKDGYHQTSLRKNGKTHTFGVHVLVLLAFVGPRPNGMECIHLDNNRANNNPHNLKWGTRSENQQMRVNSNPESYRNRRYLSKDEIAEIKIKCSYNNITQVEVAAQYGVSETTVSKYINGHRNGKSRNMLRIGVITDMAKKVGISRPYLSEILAGNKNRPSWEMASRLAAITQTSVALWNEGTAKARRAAVERWGAGQENRQ